MKISELDAPQTRALVADLVDLLDNCVTAGASIGFVLPLQQGELESYWLGVANAVETGVKRLLVARHGGSLVGTLQLALEPRANGAHRAEVQKLLVPTWARRQGIAEALMRHAETAALANGRFLLVLDTRVGDDAQRLYARLGYELAGVIPLYARSPDRSSYDGSAFMYKVLAQPE